MNEAAQALGRMAKGKKKNISDAERQRRADAMRANQAKRWAGHVKKERQP